MATTANVQDTRPLFPVADHPFKELSGRVRRGDEQHPNFQGGAADIWIGLLDDGKENPIKVRAFLNRGTYTPLMLSIKVAIKILRSGQGNDPAEWQRQIASIKRHLNRETWAWSALRHKNVLKFLGIDTSLGRPGGYPALVSPYCENGTIGQYLCRCPEVDRLPLLRGIALGLEYLHSQEVVHGDLKPNNVLIGDSGQPLISDFGCSKVLHYQGFTATKPSSSCPYQAPELMQPDSKKSGKLTKASDVYAFAITAFEIWAGQIPHKNMNDPAIIVAVVVYQLRPGCPEPPPAGKEHLWPILEKCWKNDADDRPPMEQVVKDLSSQSG